jgi:hypothetical protein
MMPGRISAGRGLASKRVLRRRQRRLHYGNLGCKGATMLIPLVLLALAAAPAAVSQAKPAPIDAAMVTQHRGWIDDQARWNAQHMAAARRLEAVAAALRRHDTSFDRHGSELRDHERQIIANGHRKDDKSRHLALAAAHAKAAESHRRLMAEVTDLERTIAENLAADRFPPR